MSSLCFIFLTVLMNGGETQPVAVNVAEIQSFSTYSTYTLIITESASFPVKESFTEVKKKVTSCRR